jgi:hypothetical protein
LLHPLRLVVEFPAIPIHCIEGDSVVVEHVGWSLHYGILNKSREMFPAKKAQDAIGVVVMTPCILHNITRPVQVIKKKY